MYLGKIWEEIVGDFRRRGYDCYTNVIGEEEPLEGERTGDTEFVTVEDASAVASGLPFIIGIELHR